ncbi:MAG TPA: type IV pili methyl-accepting chemotaxis transducer N-terminal domain-containing protein [Polyangiaceae bacterium]|nr:type IV pili methyl-accepting chemotaxis transducer N-terminal domain-containing protein [Polyangiaceae bacterium]
MFSTISGRMITILTAFALLLATGVFASRVILQQQADDGLLVNLAGRQRMLTQKMTKESAQLVNAAHEHNEASVASLRDQLQNTMRVFEATLIALKDGGPAPLNLDMTRVRQAPAAATPEISKQLGAVDALWRPFKKQMGTLIQSNGADASAAAAVMSGNLQLMGEMDAAVTLMQQDSERKVNVLFWVQYAALGLGLGLVGIGVWVARSTIARPIIELAAAARSMSTGNLNVELNMEGTDEVKELGESFDRMRASMVAAMGGGLAATGTDDDDL